MTTLSPAPPGPMTAAEFLDWAAREDVGRVELVDGEVVAMARETRRHGAVKKAVSRAMDAGIEASGIACTSYIDGLAVIVADDTAYIPDVVVDCGTSFGDDDLAAERPVIVAEVLSRSTSRMDRADKYIGYFGLEDVAHYLIVDPFRRVVIHHRRNGDKVESGIHAAGALSLDPPGFAVEVGGFWHGLSSREERR